MTAVLLAGVVMLCAVSLQQTQSDLMSFRIPSVEGERSISLWEKEDGRFYVFLPSYADLNQMEIDLHTESPVQISGILLEEGMRCSSFALDTPYAISWHAWGKTHQREITFLQSANVPAMYVDTQSGSMDYIHQKKGNKETGWMTVYRADGSLDYSGQMESIQGRGNNTWTEYEKKPYSIILSEKADLLGLGAAQRWILLANAADPTNLRNKIAYEFADAVGLPYSPDSTWADVYLNGEYAGLYLLSERNEVHPERVDLAEDGSFLVSVERQDRIESQNYPHVATDASRYLRIHYPQTPSDIQLKNLEKQWHSVENAILAEDGIDPATGSHWTKLIDVESWVKKYLMEEIFGNIDACHISQFFYSDGNSAEKKIYAGPVWDYDVTMGSDKAWQLSAPNTLYANRLHVSTGIDSPWFYQLYRKDAFFETMVNVYQEEYLPLLQIFLENIIVGYVNQIADACQMDQIRWYTDPAAIDKQFGYIRDYMHKRSEFLSSIWIDQEPYCIVKADHGMGGAFGYFAVFPGENLKDLPEFEDTENLHFTGWYYKDSGNPVDPEKPVTEDMEIYAKWQNKSSRYLGWMEKMLPLGMFMLCFGLVFLEESKSWNWRRLRKK